MINKISSYIGFAKKSKQVVLGTDNILKSNKTRIVLISSSLSIIAKKKLEKNNKVFVLKESDFEDMVSLPGVKALAITDENLANAIKNILEVQ